VLEGCSLGSQHAAQPPLTKDWIMKSIKKRLALFALAALGGGAIAYPPPIFFCHKV